MNIIYITGILSLIIQIITSFIDYYVLSLEIPNELNLLKQLLLTEFVVQTVEGVFYVWMVMNFAKISNITRFRYYDWMITTPTMLITYSLFLIYLKNNEDKKETHSMLELIKENWKVLLPIIILNGIMLLFGYLGEINALPMITANILGFIPFLIYFAMIYNTFAKDFYMGRLTFIVFFGLWLLYGVASFFSYSMKNVSYNILDLFAKNFFGIFLAFLILYKTRKIKESQKEIQKSLKNN
jgi:glycopeptide antibiotics resistance protein